MAKEIQNTLYTGDNLYILNGMNSKSVDLIYLDPPSNPKRIHSEPIGSKVTGASFKDIWTWHDVDTDYLNDLENHPALMEYIWSIGQIHSEAMMSYITYMTQRLFQMHRVLKDTGSLYLHINPIASHYLKVVLDEIFGKDNFLNEIVWSYRTGGSSAKRFAQKHDIILFYAKTREYYFNKTKEKSYAKAKEQKACTINYDEENNNFLEYHKGDYNWVDRRDVWEISALSSKSKERTGYPTQKPLELLYRIIEASSKEGDIILDPFCGCATACVAAQKLQRKWIGIDIEHITVDLMIKRLGHDTAMFEEFIHTDRIPQRTDIKHEKPSAQIKNRLFEEQKGLCNGCKNKFNIADFDINHIIPKSKGGGSHYDNLQLLCENCTRLKGNKSMEDLIVKLRTRENAVEKNILFVSK